MGRTLLMHLGIFAFFVAWDFVVAVGVRLTAGQSAWAVPMAALYNGFWFYGVTAVATRRAYAPTIIGAAALGTWLGIQ